jgi:hypothetical protein
MGWGRRSARGTAAAASCAAEAASIGLAESLFIGCVAVQALRSIDNGFAGLAAGHGELFFASAQPVPHDERWRTSAAPVRLQRSER